MSPNARPWLTHQKNINVKGLTLLELIATIGVLGALAAISAPAFTIGIDPLNDTIQRIEGNVKLARTKAIEKTTAHRIRFETSADGTSQFIVEQHSPDSGTSSFGCEDVNSSPADGHWRRASGVVAEGTELDEGVTFSTLNQNGNAINPNDWWALCFDARGIASRNTVFGFSNEEGEQNGFEVLAGGTFSSLDAARFSNDDSVNGVNSADQDPGNTIPDSPSGLLGSGV